MNLFNQILYMSIIASVIGIIILGIRKITHRRFSPQSHSMIWIAFIIALIFPVSIPSRISIYNYIDITNIKEVKENSIRDAEYEKTNQEISQINNSTAVMFSNKLKMIFIDIWFVILLIKLLGMLFSYKLLRDSVGNDEVRDERVIKTLENCKKELNIKRKIKVMKQNFVKSPSIVGLFDIKLLFTEEMLKLDDTSMKDVMMHELSHYKRKDNILNIFIMLIRIVYWFNPLVKMLCKYVKTDMELATDQMAIQNMDKDEKIEYCKVVLTVTAMCNTKTEEVLGMANGVSEIERRVDMILLQEKFEKYAILILLATIFISLLMYFVFYPTSYGIYDIPKLYLELENGERVEASRMENNEEVTGNTIKIKEGQIVKLLTRGGKCKNGIVCEPINLNDEESKIRDVFKVEEELYCLEKGEYICKFKLTNQKNQTIEYAIKIVVE